MFTKDTNKTKDMEMIEDMENRNNHKNQKTVKTDKTDKTASAIFSESLKSLMQIFIESAKSAKSIFATSATSASAIFVGKASCESTVMYRVKSRIPSCCLRYGLDSILSRFSLASLICLCMLTVGVGSVYGAGAITVTSSAITLPKGSTSVSQGDWINAAGVTKAGTNWAYTDWSGDQTIGSYGSISFSNAGDLNNADLLQFQKQGGYVQTTITSTAGVDIVIGYKVGGNSFTVSLTGADNVTGSSTSWSTMSISTTSTSATLKIHKDSKNAGYVSYITITPKAAPTKCATPTFSVAGGTYTTSKSVTLGCSTTGATIRYTTDGTDPTGSSTAYSSAITVDASKTIKAKAFKAGLTASDVASATYTIKCATPTFSVAGGTKNNDVNVTLSTTFGTSIYYTTDGTPPTTNSTLYSSAITVNATQTIKAIAVKSGCSDSDVASATYTMVCSNPLLSKTTSTNYNDFSVTITTATTDGVIRYTLDGNDPTESSAVYSSAIAITSSETLKAKVFKSGYTASSVASATYTMQCYQPTFSDAAGTYYSDKSEAISTATVGATIYYTTNGVDPTTSDTEYSSAVSISSTTTLKAIAVKSGYNNSSIKSATFTIKCVQPTSDPAVGGTYTGPQDIELATTYGTKIYYTLTTDGSTPAAPTTSSTEYTDPIHITTTTKIKAIAWKSGCTNSNQLSGTYTIQYNVTWKVDGETYKPFTDTGEGTDGQALVNSGAKISTLPTAPSPADYCGDRFMGWTDAADGAYVHGTSNLYTTASAFPAASDDQVFYAVFADYVEK